MKILSTTLLFILMSCALQAEVTAPIGFSKISEALTFIDECLDKNNWKRLELALVPAYEEGQPNRTYWVYLKEVRKDRKLTEILEKIEFPHDKNEFSVGYCNSGPLPHAHLDFIKQGNIWHLNRIWKCR